MQNGGKTTLVLAHLVNLNRLEERFARRASPHQWNMISSRHSELPTIKEVLEAYSFKQCLSHVFNTNHIFGDSLGGSQIYLINHTYT